MKVDNKFVYNHIVDANLNPHLALLAATILRHRNEKDLLCIVAQTTLANLLGVPQRKVSRRIKNLTNLGILVAVPTKNKTSRNLRGPCQYIFLNDLTLQLKVLKKPDPNVTIPQVVVSAFKCLTNGGPPQAILRRKK